MTDTNGELTKNYNYDAFGNERNPVETDTNPFRYCGEYYDTETGLYYLRARYYDPLIGRFTQEDTHWNTANMIYGDNPQKINEREDALGLKHYSYAPQISAIVQSGNLYVYGVNNPVLYADPTGNSIILIGILVDIGIGLLLGGAVGHEVATHKGYGGSDGWDYWQYVAGCGLIGGVIGGLVGWGIGSYLAAAGAVAGAGGAASISTTQACWGIGKDGANQGIRHFFEYAVDKPDRILGIAKRLNCSPFEISPKGFQEFTNTLLNVVNHYQSLGGQMRQLGSKTVYYLNDVIIIMFDGKLQSAMVGTLKYFLNMK